MSNQDFVIANVTGNIGGGDITFNPRWGGNVKIGYDPYGLDGNPSKDTNVPSSKLAVKGNINATDGSDKKRQSVQNLTIHDGVYDGWTEFDRFFEKKKLLVPENQ